MTTEQVLLVLVCARGFQRFEPFLRKALQEYERFDRNSTGCFEQFVQKPAGTFEHFVQNDTAGVLRGFLETGVRLGCTCRLLYTMFNEGYGGDFVNQQCYWAAGWQGVATMQEAPVLSTQPLDLASMPLDGTY